MALGAHARFLTQEQEAGAARGPALAVAYGVGQVINWELQLIVEYSFEQHGFF